MPISPLPPEIIPPIPDTVTAAFEVLYLDVELVLIADVETLLYTAVCRDTSTASGGTIASRAWTAAGSATPASGSDVSFNPSWTDLTGASVTLTVTDSLGNVSAPITIVISTSMGSPVRTQDLFSAETGALAAFKGSDRTWRTFSTGVGAAIIVANGPLWGDGDKVWRTEDYLVSPALSSVPAAGVNVTSIWTELDLDADAVAAGLANGKVAFSSDAGATWTVKDGPDEPNAVLKVILSRFNPGQVHAITAGGFWQSPDAGETWGIVRAGNYRDLDENQFRSWAIEVGTGMIEAASGAAISGSGADDLVAVTSHILADRGYAAAADGSFYLLAADGATALTAGTAVPAGTPQHRGLHRTAAPDIVLAAVGSGGIVKTTDGGRATWWFLRKPSVAGAGAGPFTQIGAGLLASPPAVVVGLVVMVHTEGDGVMMRSLEGAWSRPTTTGAPRDGNIFSTAVSRDDTTRMYIAEATDAPSPSASRFWVSSDGGVTWTQKTSVPALATWLQSPTAGTIYAAGNSSGAATPGIYRSTDDGVSWTRILTDTSVSGLDSIDITSTRIWFTSINSGAQGAYNAVRYCALDGSGMTEIAGTNVTGPDILVRAWDADLALAVSFAAGVAGIVLKCVPGSAATDISPSGLGYTLQPFGVEPISATTYLVYGDGSDGESHIVRSTDSGATWTNVFTSTGGHDMMTLGATDWQFLARVTSDPNRVVALGYASTPYQQDVLISSDGGATWSVEKNTADEADGAGGFIMSAPGGLSAP
jgi:photosystem II stability/assembly factor-like uncharacterized protein